MKKWKIYYSDGFVVPSEKDYLVTGSRKYGVIAIAQEEDIHNWVFWFGHGKEWYILQKNGLWMGVDNQGLFDHVLNRLDQLRLIVQGRTLLPFSSYQEIINKMLKECRPEKTGWNPGEH